MTICEVTKSDMQSCSQTLERINISPFMVATVDSGIEAGGAKRKALHCSLRWGKSRLGPIRSTPLSFLERLLPYISRPGYPCGFINSENVECHLGKLPAQMCSGIQTSPFLFILINHDDLGIETIYIS